MPAPALALPPLLGFLAASGEFLFAAGLHLWKYKQAYARVAALTYEASQYLKKGSTATQNETPFENILALAPRLTELSKSTKPNVIARLLVQGMVACLELLLTLPDSALYAELESLQKTNRRSKATTVAIRILNSALDE